jgi:hypothetical protein
MRLSDYIAGAAYKRLVAVDLPKLGSHQHELNGVTALKKLLGDEKIGGDVSWTYFSDDETEIDEEGSFSFYDARVRHPTRSEWRLYYSDNVVLNSARPGDFLVLLSLRADPKTRLHGFIFQKHSPWARRAVVLFGPINESLQSKDQAALGAEEAHLAEQTILERLGLSAVVDPKALVAELVEEHFPSDLFPPSLDLAKLAWGSLGDLSGLASDEKLEKYLGRESELFYAIERRIIGRRITRPQAFATVEEFLKYSLTVQNRRKSRRGLSFEHHLDAVFKQAGLVFDHQARTEAKSRPDFLFPGSVAYHDPAFNPDRLRMLAAKATCKERWRQALAEAARIRVKHVCTLETAISEDQTAEMLRQNVVLVVPKRLHSTYSGAQQRQIIDLETFIKEVRTLQA